MQYFSHTDSERYLGHINEYLDLFQPLLPGFDWPEAQDLTPLDGWYVPSVHPAGGSFMLLGQLDASILLLWLDSEGTVVASHTLPGDMELADAVEQLRQELLTPPRYTPQAYVNFSRGEAMPLERDQRPPAYSAHAFLAACCTRSKGVRVPHAELMGAYEAYCDQANLWGLSEDALSRQLSGILRSCTSDTGEQVWRGVRLTSRAKAASSPVSPDAQARKSS